MSTTDWKKKAAEKRDSVLALIPEDWRIKDIPSAEEQRDVTGKFIQQYLDDREIEITETDAVGIVTKTRAGKWSAEEVAKAFCHRAAIAHQLVCVVLVVQVPMSLVDAELQTGQLPPRDLLRRRH